MTASPAAIPAGVETLFDPSGGSDTRNTQQVIKAYEDHFGQRSVRLISNAVITAANVEFVGYVDDYATYQLTYTSAGSTEIIVEFAAHVAAGSDPLGVGIEYGTGRGAHNISGGPYHLKYTGFDGSGGDMDNQLQGLEFS